MAKHPELKTYMVNTDYTCFRYFKNSIDALDFPIVSLHFENSAVLNTYPHDYLYSTRKTELCFGFIKTDRQHVLNGKQIFLLGNCCVGG